MSSKKKIGLVVLSIAVLFAILTAWRFHWTIFPQTTTDAACEGIFLMLCGYALSFTDKKLTQQEFLDSL